MRVNNDSFALDTNDLDLRNIKTAYPCTHIPVISPMISSYFDIWREPPKSDSDLFWKTKTLLSIDFVIDDDKNIALVVTYDNGDVEVSYNGEPRQLGDNAGEPFELDAKEVEMLTSLSEKYF